MIDPATLAATSAALDAASLRQRVIATNIANSQTVGFKPMIVSFEDRLDGARGDLQRGQRVSEQQLLQPIVLFANRKNDLGSNSVSMDVELGNLTRNSVHYQALVKSLNGQVSLMDLALTDGRR